jgi:hypothetical protein
VRRSSDNLLCSLQHPLCDHFSQLFTVETGSSFIALFEIILFGEDVADPFVGKTADDGVGNTPVTELFLDKKSLSGGQFTGDAGDKQVAEAECGM